MKNDTPSCSNLHLLDTSKEWDGLHFPVSPSPVTHLVKECQSTFLEGPTPHETTRRCSNRLC